MKFHLALIAQEHSDMIIHLLCIQGQLSLAPPQLTLGNGTNDRNRYLMLPWEVTRNIRAPGQWKFGFKGFIIKCSSASRVKFAFSNFFSGNSSWWDVKSTRYSDINGDSSFRVIAIFYQRTQAGLVYMELALRAQAVLYTADGYLELSLFNYLKYVTKKGEDYYIPNWTCET